MPNVQIPPGLSESGDVDHDQTQGGTEGNPHGDSAASGDVSSIQSSSDVDHDNTSGGTDGNPHSGSASTNHGNEAHNASFETENGAQSRVNSHENKNNPHSSSADTNHGNESHSSPFAVDGQSQPPENHGNGAHNANYITDAGVTSVNGQTGSVSVSAGDLPWTFQETVSLNSNDQFSISVAPPFQALLILRGVRPFNQSSGNSLELTIDGSSTAAIRQKHNDRLWGKVKIKEIDREFEGTLVESKTAESVSSPSTSTVDARDVWYPRGISSNITITTPPDGLFAGLIDVYTR